MMPSVIQDGQAALLLSRFTSWDKQSFELTDQALSATLSHLAHLLRESGDDEAATSVQRILTSPTNTAAIQKTLATHLQNPAKGDGDSYSRRLWFRNFRSRDGGGLTDTQADKLTTLTKNWALPENKITALLSCSILWVSCPALFWEGGRQGSNLLRRCVDDLERLEEIDPIKRRLILIVLSERVEQERKRMLHAKKRQRSSAKPKQQAHRTKTMLSPSLHSIVQEAWPDAGIKKQAEIKTALARHSHYGWKWQQIMPSGLLLSIPPCSTRSIERSAWKLVELEALNRYLQTLPQFTIHSHLQRAMERLRFYYHHRPSLVISPVPQNCNGEFLPNPFPELDSTMRGLSPHSESNQSSAARLGIDSFPEDDQTAQRSLTIPATSSREDNEQQLAPSVFPSPTRSHETGYSHGAAGTQPGVCDSESLLNLPISYNLGQQDSLAEYDRISPASHSRNVGGFNDTRFAMQGFSEAHLSPLNAQQINDTSIAMQWFVPDGENFACIQSGVSPLGSNAPNDPLCEVLPLPDFDSTPHLNDTSVAMSAFCYY